MLENFKTLKMIRQKDIKFNTNDTKTIPYRKIYDLYLTFVVLGSQSKFLDPLRQESSTKVMEIFNQNSLVER